MGYKLEWDKTGEHLFETGVKNCVLYPYSTEAIAVDSKDYNYGPGVVWNGITSISENPSGAEATPLYADDIKYLNLYSTEQFGATIEAYMYPDEFADCDGTASPVAGVRVGQQTRKVFGLSYKTTVGNDEEGNNHGYKLHIIYGAQASPSAKAYQSINDSPEAITFSWELNTVPVNVADVDGKKFKPTATLVIDTTKLNEGQLTNLAKLEALMYGSDSPSKEAVLPLPDEIIALIGD